MRKNNLGSVATYVVIALILAVITYVEFAIVEYDIAWLSRGAVMFWLFFLSIIKFLLVIMFFMHLKGDDKTYTGFFSAGMIMALGTFIGLIFLFTVTSVSNYIFTNESPEEITEQVAGAPPPADQSQQAEAPAADADGFEVGEEGAVEQTIADFDTDVAEAAYMANCSSCHQANGEGMPGAFPPFADGHGAELYNADGGPEYLMHTVLFGLQGEIEVHGTSYDGAMPAWPQLSDEDLAGALNHITTEWGNAELVEDFEPFTADDLAAARDDDLSPSDVHDAREALDLSDEPVAAAPADEDAEEAAEAEEEAEEETAEEPEESADDEAAEAAAGDLDLAAGEAVYTANCVSCHQAGGEGLPGAFPPLAGHVPAIYNADGGREVLLHTVLFGLQGEIDVDGDTYNGAMPGWPQFSDEETADVLNYITHAWDNDAELEDFEAYEASEIADARGAGLSAQDVHEERVALDLSASGDDSDSADDAEDADEEEADEAEEETADEAEEADEDAAADSEEDEDAEEADEAGDAADSATAADFDREAAEAAYAANCASCHNSSGAGIPQVFPPLAGHLPDLYNADGGPEVIMDIMLYGMTGGIEVNGTNYSGAMPAWDNLDDDVLADAFNHIATAWGNEDELDDFTPATAADFEALRGQDLSTAEVHELRQALDLN